MEENETNGSNSGTRRARWREEVVTEVREIPRVEEEMKTILFYNKLDYKEFQEAEQRRYDKMMMKQIQNMVTEAMSEQIKEAEEHLGASHHQSLRSSRAESAIEYLSL